MGHDVERHLNSLVQALSQDKRPCGLLLGAGCPASIIVDDGGVKKPLIPAVAGLTTKVAAELSTGPNADCYAKIHAQLVTDGYTAPSIEDVLTRVRALLQVSGNTDVRGVSTKALNDLDFALASEIAKQVDKALPKIQTGYSDVAIWISSIQRAFPVEIFTPNYDLLAEQALEAQKVPYFDGFIGSDRAFFDVHAMEEENLPPRWARLWKLHGSLNWYAAGSEVFRSMRPLSTERRVIHPSHLKYDESRKMPYLAMIDRLRAFLRIPSATLVVCGYSFVDQHINAAIVEGARSNPTAMVFGLLFGGIASYPGAQALAESRSNLGLFAEDASVIGGRRANWSHQSTTTAPPSVDYLSWEEVKGAGGVTTFRPRLKIGDFQMLGSLFRNVSGSAV